MEKWIIYALVSMVFAGLTSVIAKFGMKDMSSDSALAVRTTVVFIFVLANAFLFRNALTEVRKAAPRDLLLLAFSGLTTTVSWIFYYRAIEGRPGVVRRFNRQSQHRCHAGAFLSHPARACHRQSPHRRGADSSGDAGTGVAVKPFSSRH